MRAQGVPLSALEMAFQLATYSEGCFVWFFGAGCFEASDLGVLCCVGACVR